MRKEFGQAVEPNSVEDFMRRAGWLHREQNYKELEATLQDGLALHTDNPKLLYELAKATRFDRAKDAQTLDYFEKAFYQMPDYHRLATAYASFLHKQGKPDEAEAIFLYSYDTESPLNVQNVYTLTGIGHLYQTTGRLKESVICFGRAQTINPYDRTAKRRYDEITAISGLSYTEQGWSAFVNYARDVLDKSAHLLPEPRAPKDSASGLMHNGI